jgi:hypothetical protein
MNLAETLDHFNASDEACDQANDRIIQSLCLLDRAVENLGACIHRVKDRELRRSMQIYLDQVADHVFDLEFLSLGPIHLAQEAGNREMSAGEVEALAARLYGDQWEDRAH